MPPFERQPSSKWHEEVPGARWFRADLHIHTLDDHPSGNLRRPEGVTGLPADPDALRAYARALLRAAITNGIEVLGLTPHAVRAGDADTTSATWCVVETWNTDADDDGVPFRDKIYAVFPGFEPNLSDGADGLHLLFLFDPEVGRENYLAAFNALMGAVPPWDGGNLRVSPKRAAEAFHELRELRKRAGGAWDWICIAPHAFGAHGLFSLRSQVLQHFPHDGISAIELKDSWLPQDAFNDKEWLADGMKKYRHTFFHGSDAYDVTAIGRRFTLMKLASPRIESLRQAFLATESRLRICYEKNPANEIAERTDLPSPRPLDRAWLQTVTVKGGTSFLAGQNPNAAGDVEASFHLNPDLTCLIGGRMSGKSTFLDGLRFWFDHSLPTDDAARQDVVARAQQCFLSGNPEIHIVAHGPMAPTAPLKERWPATFYTQRELQTSVHEQEQRRQVLYRLIPTELPDLVERDRRLKEYDEQLWESAAEVEQRRTALAEAEESLMRIQAARDALDRFKEAGIESLTDVQDDQSKLQALEEGLERLREPIETMDADRPSLDVESINNDLVRAALDGGGASPAVRRLFKRYRAVVRYLRGLVARMVARTVEAREVSEVEVARVKAEVQAELVRAGGTAEELNEFEQLTATAASFEQVQQIYARARFDYSRTLREFAEARRDRSSISQQQATAMTRVADKVLERFPDRIRIRQQPGAGDERLGEWLTEFRETGVTRWWNHRQSAGGPPVTPEIIRQALRTNRLETIDMSEQVTVTFRGAMTPERKGQLAALRNEDTYAIELKIGPGVDDYRELDRLSGGAQVSLLLSLVLESDDPSPLIIDQPEDELDKAYLFDVLLPALRRLKGRRQVIFATHDANIVVNGDADHVIFLKADAEHGTIGIQGAIEQTDVKEAIIQTLDGGKEAFVLRQAKYGF